MRLVRELRRQRWRTTGFTGLADGPGAARLARSAGAAHPSHNRRPRGRPAKAAVLPTPTQGAPADRAAPPVMVWGLARRRPSPAADAPICAVQIKRQGMAASIHQDCATWHRRQQGAGVQLIGGHLSPSPGEHVCAWRFLWCSCCKLSTRQASYLGSSRLTLCLGLSLENRSVHCER